MCMIVILCVYVVHWQMYVHDYDPVCRCSALANALHTHTRDYNHAHTFANALHIDTQGEHLQM